VTPFEGDSPDAGCRGGASPGGPAARANCSEKVLVCGPSTKPHHTRGSDIAIVLSCRNEKPGQRMYWLIGRGEFKRQIERALHSSFLHSYIAKPTLLFTNDSLCQ